MNLAALIQHQQLADAAEVRASRQRAIAPQETPIMATAPVTPIPVSTSPAPAPVAPKANGFVTFLKHVGSDAKKVLSWFGTPANQQIIAAGENVGASVAIAVAPALAPEIQAGLSLVQKWTQEIFKAEAIGAAAADADPSATSLQKSAMVLSAVVPDALTFAKANGLALPTATNLQAANDALVAFWNAWGASTAPAPASAPAAPAA